MTVACFFFNVTFWNFYISIMTTAIFISFNQSLKFHCKFAFELHDHSWFHTTVCFLLQLLRLLTTETMGVIKRIGSIFQITEQSMHIVRKISRISTVIAFVAYPFNYGLLIIPRVFIKIHIFVKIIKKLESS